MKFRPCIDLHAGQVKQIVGSTLTDDKQNAQTSAASAVSHENFATDRPAAAYAADYRRDGLTGGHVIMLGAGNADAAAAALAAYPGGLQVGGGITLDNAEAWLARGASHVIVTSHVFRAGVVDWDRLDALVARIGRERLVLDLSCRRRAGADGGTADGPYYVVTDRWQTYTTVPVDADTLARLGGHCAEFLVHGVENEGKRCGTSKLASYTLKAFRALTGSGTTLSPVTNIRTKAINTLKLGAANVHALLQMILVRADIPLPWGYRHVLAHPNLAGHLVDETEVVGHEHHTPRVLLDGVR